MNRNILKKIRMLFVREKVIFSLTVICTFLSGIILCLCFGLFYNYIEKKNTEVLELTDLVIGFNNDIDHGKYITKKQIDDCVMQFTENVTDNVVMFFVRSKMENNMLLECRFTIEDGEYMPCDIVRNNLTKYGEVKNYFNEEEERNGDKVVIIPGEEWEWNDLTVINSMMIDENHVSIQGEEYRVIGYHGWGDRILIPFLSLDDNTIIDSEGLTLAFKKSISLKQYNEVKAVVENSLGDVAQIPEMPTLDAFRMTSYNTVLLIDMVIACWVALNFSVLYYYILLRRRRNIGIFLVCGMRKGRMATCITFCCHSFLLLCFILGLFFFHYILLPFISWMIPNALDHFNLLSYFSLTIIFGVVSLMIIWITIINFINRMDIIEVIKENSL